MPLTRAPGNALSGLNLTQRALGVTAHNIADAGGSVRKVLERETRRAGDRRVGVPGAKPTRSFDSFLSAELPTKQAAPGRSKVLRRYRERIQPLPSAPGENRDLTAQLDADVSPPVSASLGGAGDHRAGQSLVGALSKREQVIARGILPAHGRDACGLCRRRHRQRGGVGGKAGRYNQARDKPGAAAHGTNSLVRPAQASSWAGSSAVASGKALRRFSEISREAPLLTAAQDACSHTDAPPVALAGPLTEPDPTLYDQNASLSLSVRADPHLEVAYGVTADQPRFARLVSVPGNAAADHTTDERERLGLAPSEVSQTLDRLADCRGKNGAVVAGSGTSSPAIVTRCSF